MGIRISRSLIQFLPAHIMKKINIEKLLTGGLPNTEVVQNKDGYIISKHFGQGMNMGSPHYPQRLQTQPKILI